MGFCDVMRDDRVETDGMMRWDGILCDAMMGWGVGM